jgi:DNA-binding LacI/PurR family transcriptional regulator
MRQRGARERATIADVAREAGVSKTTVSIVLNGLAANGRVRAETRTRIQTAAEQLGYTPSHAAQVLRSRRTMVLALLVQSLANPLLVDLAVAARAAAERRGYEVDVVDARTEEAEVAALRKLHAGRADGVIVATGRHFARGAAVRELRALVERGLPAVVLIDRSPDPAVPAIRADIDGGSYAAVRHLLDLGHRRIALLVLGAPGHGASSADLEAEPSSLADRFRAYRRALSEGGVTYDPRWLIRGPFGLVGGREMVAPLLAVDPRPTAAFVYSDPAAIGVIRGLDEAGLRVPEDIAVVGFGGTEVAAFTRPSLTTVAVPAAEMADIGIGTFFALLEGEVELPADRLVETRLIVRESCGAQRGC